jgi:hypothetical protein
MRMLHEPGFQNPESLRSLLQRAALTLAAGERLPDAELATIIEKHRGKALPREITDYLAKHFRGEIRARKGPKLQSDAVKDFRFGPAAILYRRALPVFEYLARRRKRVTVRRRKTQTGPGDRSEKLTPSEGALQYVLDNRPEPDDLGNISVRGLANAISEWKNIGEPTDFPDDNPNAHPTDESDSDTSAE